MARQWTRDEVLQLARSFQPACVITAAADLNVFSALSGQPMTATDLAGELKADSRAMAVLLDALVAMELLDKSGTQYRVPPDVAEALTERGGDSVLPMVRHNANCLRRWVQLARVVKSGRPAERESSIRGKAADQESFIGGMHNVFMQGGEGVVSELIPLSFGHLLDVGGASGS
ncbi:MAG: polyketide synthesis methyltransferase, partial [Planctomycetota bacterium]